MYMENKDRELLINRLNRISGQLDAIKKSIKNGEDQQNCREVLLLIKTTNNALKKAGEAYVRLHIDKCSASGDVKKQVNEIMDVMSGW